MATLLLSDLHLPAAPSPLRARFVAFLQGPARASRAVYILGDLFEYWIGDDVGLSVYRAEIDALTELTAAGIPVYVQHGNRDFLLSTAFERRSGAVLLPDPTIVELEGRRTLLTHGDQLCTDDVGYQRWRRVSHQPLVQRLFLSLPRTWRERVAGGLRGKSRGATQNKSLAIMDVNREAARRQLLEHQVDRLIHGHTHRPDRHVEIIAGRRCERIVLADWRADRCEYLKITAQAMQRLRVE